MNATAPPEPDRPNDNQQISASRFMITTPTALEIRDGNRLSIAWSDGTRRDYTFRELRDSCPCASCREKRNAPAKPMLLPVLSAAEIQPLKISAMTPVGNYAYSITFSDGHDTGIFTLEFLREHGTAVE
jgi:DUF971 family protein